MELTRPDEYQFLLLTVVRLESKSRKLLLTCPFRTVQDGDERSVSEFDHRTLVHFERLCSHSASLSYAAHRLTSCTADRVVATEWRLNKCNVSRFRAITFSNGAVAVS